ncbi:hypothetical protein F5Y16DRAFT_354482 [Xylariaceae sp. FL0255]|nr:hypothetical protein F5Y16DRAFT_354482 [Xylariaceae sp. FL0255]
MVQAEVNIAAEKTGRSEFVPTRLIYVPSSNSAEPRLVLRESMASRSPHYAALSYCWGSALESSTQLKLTINTLTSMLARIPRIDLSPIIQDAITVCGDLSIKYIWIDALCIIQDSKVDWENESS